MALAPDPGAAAYTQANNIDTSGYMEGAQSAAGIGQTNANIANINAQAQGQQITNSSNLLALQRQQTAMAGAQQFAQTNQDGTPKIDPSTGAQSFDSQGYNSWLLSQGLTTEAQKFMQQNLANQQAQIKNETDLQTYDSTGKGFAASYATHLPPDQIPSFIDNYNQHRQQAGLAPVPTAPQTDANGNALSPSQQGQWYQQNIVPSLSAGSMSPANNDANTRANQAANNTPAATDPTSPISQWARQQVSKYGLTVPDGTSYQQMMNDPTMKAVISTGGASDVQTGVTKSAALGDGVQYAKNDTIFNTIQGDMNSANTEYSTIDNTPLSDLTRYTNPQVQAAIALAKSSLPPDMQKQLDFEHGINGFNASVQSLKTANAGYMHQATVRVSSPTTSGAAASLDSGVQAGTAPQQAQAPLPTPKSQAEFDALPSKARFLKEGDSRVYTKP